jgi:hypothetical protein
MLYMGHSSASKLLTVYLELKHNWASCFVLFLFLLNLAALDLSTKGWGRDQRKQSRRTRSPWAQAPSFWFILHCPIRLHLENTASKMKVFRVSKWQPQGIAPQAGIFPFLTWAFLPPPGGALLASLVSPSKLFPPTLVWVDFSYLFTGGFWLIY